MQGYKLVGLMVAEAQSNLHSPEPLSNPLDSAEPPLRATALWCPTVPPQGLCLNDASFVRMSQSKSGIQHMTWVLFGGCGGEHLPTLIGVTASDTILHSIQFYHENQMIRDQTSLFQDLQFHSTDCTSRWEHFPIDGKGGERIIALAAGGVYRNGESKFAFEIATNRGRSFQFGTLGPESSLVLKSLSIEHGTTIVGFFICHVRLYARVPAQVLIYQQHPDPVPGVVGFGVISAKV
jgi:hypothetical protein